MVTRTSSMRIAFYGSGETVRELKERVIRDGLPAATDDDIVDDLIRFANARGIELAGLIESAVTAAARVDALLSSHSGKAQTTMADYTRSVSPIAQRWVIEELAKIVLGTGSFQRLDIARPGIDEASPLAGSVIIERDVKSGRRWTQERRFAFASIENYAQWAVLRLRDHQTVSDLCRCQLEECQRFFLAVDSGKSGGRTRRTYCSDEHMLEKHRKTSAARVARSRARRKGK